MPTKLESSLPVVGVLLATSNPPEYISEQVKSIENQIGVVTKIYWGDYGSSDNVKKFIRNLLKNCNYAEIKIDLPGPAANFFELLRNSKEEFIAFADQDDIWLPNKLQEQVATLRKTPETPSLDHSTVQILKGGELLPSRNLCANHSFEALAFSNCCQGCTIMINSKAQNVILDSLPDKIHWHDWWIGLVISVTGAIHKSESTQVIYRIHDSNTIGIPTFRKKVLNVLKRNSGLVSYQIEEIMQRFELNNKASNQELDTIAGLVSRNILVRLKYIIRDKKRRNGIFQDFLRRLLWVAKRP